MNSNKIKTKFLYGFYPYTRIIEGDTDVFNKICHFALIYRDTVVGLGIKNISTSNQQGIYIDIIHHQHVAMKKRIHDLCLGDDAAMSLWVKIKDMKVAKRDKLPEPEPKLIYRIYGVRNDEMVEYRVLQYPWFNNHKKYQLGYLPKYSDKLIELHRSNNIKDLANLLTTLTNRKITLV